MFEIWTMRSHFQFAHIYTVGFVKKALDLQLRSLISRSFFGVYFREIGVEELGVKLYFCDASSWQN